ncbi:MAG: dihydropteroate synthase [Colwellia polaris]|jgi:dihydropteroate synthase|uniref:dihydropteroate synthase n=1 Tax=Colwellia polaris TaxID=326537 RepID=UPI000A1737BF|nr:dihydropteroate synthase [Colwellia polaris]|tara:strand:+ start:21913 stop:22692 length:780 start_codon:yes stop_codon:yes gene_type:complete
MGILNVTPDSFSDGGKFADFEPALAQVQRMITDGATIIDIGGESTRPGAEEVSEADELARVIPVLKAIKKRFNILVSVDTSKAKVMSAAIAAGADIINDVRALQNEGCLAALAASNTPVCLMHMQGLPRTMQNNPSYEDLINDIIAFFQQRINACVNAGISRDRIILDPGFGFGKTLEQNFHLLANVSKFSSLGLPILAGMSRKSMIGNLLNREVDQRLAGSISTALIAAQQGAHIIRVHDVQETADALNILKAVTDNR